MPNEKLSTRRSNELIIHHFILGIIVIFEALFSVNHTFKDGMNNSFARKGLEKQQWKYFSEANRKKGIKITVNKFK